MRESKDSVSRHGALSFEEVSFTYPSRDGRLAIREVSFAVEAGRFVSVVGPSGCGKSTLLSLAAGLSRPTSGVVRLNGRPVQGIDRQVGFIFQRDALLPWRTALDNVALSLRFRGVPKGTARSRAREWLDRVGLLNFEDYYPHQLSGGMRKRVAIAATMVYEPTILLMDEPFSALDPQTRNIMENDLLALWEAAGGQTVIFVTHDLEEAIGLSDRVVVLSASPGTVVNEYAIDLERPRDLLDIRFEPRFNELYKNIWTDLKGEVKRAYGSEHGGAYSAVDAVPLAAH